MSGLDRIFSVPLMFLMQNGALARLAGHAKVTPEPGGHARRPLAAGASGAYLSGLPDLLPDFDFVAVPPSGTPSHGLI